MEYLTKEDLCDIVYGDHELFSDVTSEVLEGSSRWTLHYSKIVKDDVSGAFYRVFWEMGATEYQECELEPTMQRVYPKQVVTTVYTTQKD